MMATVREMLDPVSIKLWKQLELHSGRHPKIHHDPEGYRIIGVGHKIDGKPLPDAVIDLLFQLDLEDAKEDVRILFPNFRELSSPRQAVLIDLAFDLGREALASFKNFRKSVSQKSWNWGAGELKGTRWYMKNDKDRGPRLVQQWVTGEWVEAVDADFLD